MCYKDLINTTKYLKEMNTDLYMNWKLTYASTGNLFLQTIGNGEHLKH